MEGLEGNRTRTDWAWLSARRPPRSWTACPSGRRSARGASARPSFTSLRVSPSPSPWARDAPRSRSTTTISSRSTKCRCSGLKAIAREIESAYAIALEARQHVAALEQSSAVVDALKRAELSLSESEQWFRTLVAKSTDLIVVIDNKACFTYTNPVVDRLFGYEPNALLGVNIFDLVHPDDRQSATDAYIASTAGDGPDTPWVIRFLTSDGQWRYIEGVLDRLLQRPGNPRHRRQRTRRHRAHIPHPGTGDLERRQPGPDARYGRRDADRRPLSIGRRGGCLPARLGRIRPARRRQDRTHRRLGRPVRDSQRHRVWLGRRRAGNRSHWGINSHG